MASAESCPACGAAIASATGWPSWCSCGHGLAPVRRDGQSRLDRLGDRLGDRVATRVRDELLAGRGSRTRPALLAAYALAAGAGAMIVAMIAGGAWIVIAVGSLLAKALSVLVAAIGLYALPWPERREVDPGTVTRETTPALFDLLDEVAATTSTRLPRRVIVDDDANASIAANELRLGLPLVLFLGGQGTAGLIGHELGHAASRDPTRSRVTGTAIYASYRLATIAYPPDTGIQHAGRASAQPTSSPGASAGSSRAPSSHTAT